MSFKIIHLVNDEKFIHFIADIFNNCEGVCNQFLVIVPDTSEPLKYVAMVPNIRIIDKKYILSSTIKKDLESCNAVLIHFLDPMKAMITLRLPKHIPVVWSGWGADYYDYITNWKGTSLGVESAKLQESFTNQQMTTNLLYIVVKRAIEYLRATIKNYILDKLISRVSYFSSPVPEDFDLLKSSLRGKFKAKYVQINYGSVGKTFSIGPIDYTGNDILVGNSATVTNNHLEIFHLLSKLDLNGRRIVVPLSYGRSNYRDAVIENGYKYFGELFHPVVDLIPLEQYNKLIARCSIGIMGHRRQQAVGNTSTMLYKGAKVFLDEKSTVYQFFRKHDAIIFSLNELNENRTDIFSPLSAMQKHKNRNVLKALWGDDLVQNNAYMLVEQLQSDRPSTNK